MLSFRLWSIGLLLGAVAALVVPYTFALYGLPLVVAVGLAVAATVARPRPAGAAGFLLTTGAGWSITLQRAAELLASARSHWIGRS